MDIKSMKSRLVGGKVYGGKDLSNSQVLSRE